MWSLPPLSLDMGKAADLAEWAFVADEQRAGGLRGSKRPSGEGDRIRPPIVGSPTELPFRDLSPTRFERLCQDIAKTQGFTQVRRYGKPGQAQHGIDFRGVASDGRRFEFQSKQVAGISATELEEIVARFADGPLATAADTFVVCMSVEGNERQFQDAFARLQKEHLFEIDIWDATELTHRLRGDRSLVQTYFGPGWVERFFTATSHSSQQLDSEALLLGPVQALNLGSPAREAQRLARTSPVRAAGLYGEIEAALRKRFPGHADRFQQLRAAALKKAGDLAASHDVLMELAIRGLFERAAPRLRSEVERGLHELRGDVDEVRQAVGTAVSRFGRWYEHPGELAEVAACFDTLGPDNPCAPFIALLVCEAALVDRDFQIVRDRDVALQTAGDHGDRQIALRVRVALADVGTLEGWPRLLAEAEALRFPTPEGSYVCLRGARWCAWNGQFDRAVSLYRLALKLGAEADLDLDVENALWSLSSLYTSPDRWGELFETNQLALSIGGTRSYVALNSQTRRASYEYLASGKLPDASLWTRHRLLESIRGACLMEERESHTVLARIHGQSGQPFVALEHAVLGGAKDLVKEIAPSVDAWPDFLADAVVSAAPWVRPVALSALEALGDIAPAEVAGELARVLLRQLLDDADDIDTAPALFQALATVVLEATNDDLGQLMPMLAEATLREPGKSLHTDPGVGMLAARVYRFRPAFRQQAASVLSEMAIGAHTDEWWRALDECGDDRGELVDAVERVSEREGVDLVSTLSVLGHLTASTRALWSQRLQFVAEHPLGPRSDYRLMSGYDVPADFLAEQEEEVIQRYVEKLVAIGSDREELVINREVALLSAGNAVSLLATDKKRQLFDRVRPLTDRGIEVSEVDRLNARSQQPLSRFKISIGSPTRLRAAAARLMGLTAAEPNECSLVLEMALEWIWSDDAGLQEMGAALLTLPKLPSNNVRSADLAMHRNPGVRCAALGLPAMKTSPDVLTLERLASDPAWQVRLRVAYVFPLVRTNDPDSYERIRATLNADRSAIVRATAAETVLRDETAGSDGNEASPQT